MRIAFSGAACTGKTTTVNHFLQTWPSYTSIKSKYRELIKDKKTHSKNTTSKLQGQILDILCEEQNQFTASDKVVYDRCSLDNLVYSMWAYGKGKKGFTDQFIEESIQKVRKSMQDLDIIFVCLRDLMPPIIEDNKIRETDPEFVDEINNLFKAICSKFSKGVDTLPFMEPNNSPAIIELHGEPHERIAQISLYVTEDGGMYGEDQSLIDLNELAEMKKLLFEQKDAIKKERNPIIGL